MARLSRVVVPGYPHHITQRGNRRQQTFFSDEDYQSYIDLMAEWCRHFNVEIWSYCLMPNHTHLIAVPATSDGLASAIGEAHRRYARMVNFREGWRGYFWQGRFASFIMDERHLLAAARYIEQNPVRAGLVKKAEEYQWSSCRAHLNLVKDPLVKTKPLFAYVDKWDDFITLKVEPNERDALQKHERTGRPLGENALISQLEAKTGRVLTKKKTGPKGPRKQR
ncbi:transposase [Desulfobacter hydrogenophilus]|uniref:Transposase n=1 Tax=Desulfobacter hydrogenophilus TaxID=2291 RepID=A0A328F5T8_9BACT|nr:transposase [Desulfobacter hydrogenophilus]NDY74545.1 transposase [Desulfobacter hydrogenophilus]QBH12315.1 transposase [Desulfobacter hydrogenophilus]RAL99890.1 transposase [Desulfobacter hydrogenophilus]